MWAKHLFVICSCIKIKGEVSRKKNKFMPDHFSVDRSVNSYLLAVIANALFTVLSRFVPHLQ